MIDLYRAVHLHYAGAALLAEVPGLRLAGASRYVRELLCGGRRLRQVELHADVEEAVRAG